MNQLKMNGIPNKLAALLISFIAAMLSLIVLGETLGQAEIKLTRVTHSSQPGTNIRLSQFPSISCDGARIAFYSDSDFLNQGIPNNQDEIWLYDANTDSLTRLTFGEFLRGSFEPSISADGRRIAFYGDADLLNQGLQDGRNEIWLYDTVAMDVTRLTSSTQNFRGSFGPSLSADGTKVAFYSDVDYLSQGIPFNQDEIWLLDLDTGAITRATFAVPEGRRSTNPSINADGTRIVFTSNADFFNQGIPGTTSNQIWLYDTYAMTVTRVTSASFPSINNQNYLWPTISGDGSRIVFVGNGDLDNQGVDRQSLWLYDTTTLTYTRVTSSPTIIRSPRISLDGRTIVFETTYHPISGTLLSDAEYWLYDIPAATFNRIISTTGFSVDSNEALIVPNGDGRIVAFQSDTDYLGDGDITPGQWELWRALITPSISISSPLPTSGRVYLPIVAGGVGSSTPVIWEEDTFDSLTAGELDGQNGWQRAAPDRAAAIVTADGSGGNLLHVDPDSHETIVMNKDVPDQAGGQHALTVRVLVDGQGCAALHSLAKIEVRTNPNSGWEKKFQLYFGSLSMRFNYGPDPSNAVVIVPRTELGQWYTIQVLIDLDAELADVLVDGALITSNVPIHPGPIVDIGLSGWDLPGYVQLDDLRGEKR